MSQFSFTYPLALGVQNRPQALRAASKFRKSVLPSKDWRCIWNPERRVTCGVWGEGQADCLQQITPCGCRTKGPVALSTRSLGSPCQKPSHGYSRPEKHEAVSHLTLRVVKLTPKVTRPAVVKTHVDLRSLYLKVCPDSPVFWSLHLNTEFCFCFLLFWSCCGFSRDGLNPYTRLNRGHRGGGATITCIRQRVLVSPLPPSQQVIL